MNVNQFMGVREYTPEVSTPSERLRQAGLACAGLGVAANIKRSKEQIKRVFDMLPDRFNSGQIDEAIYQDRQAAIARGEDPRGPTSLEQIRRSSCGSNLGRRAVGYGMAKRVGFELGDGCGARGRTIVFEKVKGAQ